MEEIWKDIPEHSPYQASSDGQIRSLKFGRKRTLRLHTTKYGYQRVPMSVAGKDAMRSVARMVAFAFVPNPNNLPCVNHIDSNRSNNNASNLEWVSYRENNSHYRIKQEGKTSKYVGVIKVKHGFISSVFINNKRINLGSFRNEELAHNAYIDKLNELGITNKYAS